jgi:anti-sigma B factor antagonist
MLDASKPYGLSRVHADGRTVIAVSGEIDIATVDEVAAVVREELMAGPVSLDLHELSFMDSSGLRMLLDLLRQSEQAGWSLTIGSELRQNVRQLLDVAGIIDVLPFDGDGPSRSSS